MYQMGSVWGDGMVAVRSVCPFCAQCCPALLELGVALFGYQWAVRKYFRCEPLTEHSSPSSHSEHLPPPSPESKHLCQPQEAEILREEALAATL